VADVPEKDYSRLKIDGFPDVLCFNDKQIGKGNPVYLSIRPEKFHISREEPVADNRHNKMLAHVDDVIYLGTHTKYWVRIQDYRLAVFRQHSRFLLDEKPIRWNEDVWIRWHADDGFMLERYSESDERLTNLPPQKVGENGLDDSIKDENSDPS
jgi:spermidine/putrescine transport system ATP-binding protein